MRKPPAWVTRKEFSWLDLAVILALVGAYNQLPQHIKNWIAVAVWIAIAACATWRVIRSRQPKGTP